MLSWPCSKLSLSLAPWERCECFYDLMPDVKFRIQVRWKQAGTGIRGNCAWQTPRCCELVEETTTPRCNSWASLELRTLGFRWGHRQAHMRRGRMEGIGWRGKRLGQASHARAPELTFALAAVGVKFIASVPPRLSGNQHTLLKWPVSAHITARSYLPI